MVVANRSSSLVVVLSAFCALLAIGLEGGWRAFAKKARRFLSMPVGILFSAFLLWGLISSAWSDAPSLSLKIWGEFVLVFVASVILMLALPSRLQRRHVATLWIASIAGCGLILFDFATGFALRQWFSRRAISYIYNRPVLTLLLIIIPFVGGWISFVLTGGRAHTYLRLSLAGSLILFCIVLAVADSGAAVLGAVVACIAYGMVRFLPRLAMGAAVAGLIVSLLVAPFIGPIMDRFFPAVALDALQAAHARERIEIWRVFGDATMQRPVAGAGFAVSSVAANSQAAQQLSLEPNQLAALNMGHPHNWALQVWYELGAIGALLAVTIALFLLRVVWKAPLPGRWSKFAFFATVTIVSLTAHGAWQGWWTAAIGAAIVWFMAVDHSTTSDRGCSFERETH